MKLSVQYLRQIIKETMTQLEPWEELSRKEQIIGIYSDVYKEKHGIRPRWIKWDDITVDEAEKMLQDIEDEDDSFLDDPFPDDLEQVEDGLAQDEAPGKYDDHPMERYPSRLGMGRR